MITYIVTEKRAKYETNAAFAATIRNGKITLEKHSGTPCLVQFYEDVTLDELKALRVEAIIFSGYVTPLQEHGIESFRGIYGIAREADLPMLGLCGGHQLLAELWAEHNDKTLTKMHSYRIRKLRKREPDRYPAIDPGYFKEWGFHPISIVQRDPLFKGVRTGFMANEMHRNEVKKLPKEFDLLASTETCRVQAYRHKSRCIYGVQFHAEGYTAHYPDGQRILDNFFEIAGVK